MAKHMVKAVAMRTLGKPKGGKTVYGKGDRMGTAKTYGTRGETIPGTGAKSGPTYYSPTKGGMYGAADGGGQM